MITDVFQGPDRRERLHSRLGEAQHEGADIAVLPELPLNPWSPATRESRPDDAEPPEGLRHTIQSDAANEAVMWLVGGAIVADPTTGERHNTALVFNRTGTLLYSYEKTHVPDEPGFWEKAHYQPGRWPAMPVEGLDMPFGVQICSDANRPQGAHILSGAGAQVIFVPRSTQGSTWARWKLVLGATALTTCAYIVTVNRPGPEAGVEIGGPSAVFGPDGNVLLETMDSVAVIELDGGVIADAWKRYPGYLDVRPPLYVDGWGSIEGS